MSARTMANIDRSLRTGSELAQRGPSSKRPYGAPAAGLTFDVQTTAGLTVASLVGPKGLALAECDVTGLRNVALTLLDPLVLPYVNAFIRPHGRVEKYWRTGQYRLVSKATITVTPAPSSTVAPTPVGATAQRATPTKVASIKVTAPVAAPVTTTAPAPRRGSKATSLVAPAGYVIVPGRSGDLVIPERTLQTWDAAVASRRAGEPAHPLAIGPAGTGKTESVLALAVRDGFEVAGIVQCGGIEGPGDLYGATIPDDTAAHGWRRYPSVLWTALAVARDNPDREYIVVLDEVNRMASTSAQNALLGAMDGTAHLQNPTTGEGIPVPSNLFIVATANIGMAYAGTVRLDGALASRFWTNLVFGYLPEPVEQALFESLGLSKPESKKLARLAAEIRKADATEPFRTALVPGSRDCVQVAKQARFDVAGVEGAWHDKVTSSFSSEGRNAAQTEYARARLVEVGIFDNKGTVAS